MILQLAVNHSHYTLTWLTSPVRGRVQGLVKKKKKKVPIISRYPSFKNHLDAVAHTHPGPLLPWWGLGQKGRNGSQSQFKCLNT